MKKLLRILRTAGAFAAVFILCWLPLWLVVLILRPEKGEPCHYACMGRSFLAYQKENQICLGHYLQEVREMDIVEIQNVKDELEAQRKRCEIGIILCNLGQDNLIPTVLEDMHEAQQSMTDNYCVVRNGS